MYRESDKDRRVIAILKPNKNLEDEDLQKIPDLELVFRCEIDEGHSKYFSGLCILTFKKKISAMTSELVENDKVLYVSLLKDYVMKKTRIIKENPIENYFIPDHLSLLNH